jgi:hypothetical protein
MMFEANNKAGFSTGRLLVTICLGLALGLASACTTRLNQFQALSQAGVAYTQALEPLLDEAAEAALNRNSLYLIQFRNRGDRCSQPQVLQREIDAHNQKMAKRLELLRQIKQHGRLLRAYFTVLAGLAGSEAPEKISAAAAGITEQTLNIGGRLGTDAQVAQQLPGIISGAAGFVVQAIKVKALEEELEKRGPVIYKQILLHQAAVRAVSGMLLTDTKIYWQRAKRDVHQQYVMGGCPPLPDSWMQKRRQALTMELSLQSADAAQKAVAKLGKAYQRLAKGEAAWEEIGAVFNELDEMMTWLNSLRQLAQD